MHASLLRVLSIRNLYYDPLMRRLEWNGESLGLILAVNACIYEGGHAVAKRVVKNVNALAMTPRRQALVSLGAVYQQIVDRD